MGSNRSDVSVAGSEVKAAGGSEAESSDVVDTLEKVSTSSLTVETDVS